MAITITIHLTDAQERCMKHDLLDVETWVQGMVDGKVNSCRKRLIKEGLPRLYADKTLQSIPASEDALEQLITGRPDYQDRAARERSDRERKK